MRKMVMNVTPREFKEIWEVWGMAATEHEQLAAVGFMENYYGCERYTEYRLVVHWNAPCVPMMSWGLDRFQPDYSPTKKAPTP